MNVKAFAANKFSLDEAINKFTGHLLTKGFNIVAIHPYGELDDKPDFWRIRLKNFVTGEKIILPLHINKENQYVLSEPKYIKGKRPLYNIAGILNSIDEIIVVEGEACVDKLKKRGLTATTSGSWNSAAGADWAVLAGREIIIWPDLDENGDKYASAVASTLLQLNCKVSIIDAKKLQMDDKEDCVDWCKRNPDATHIEILGLPRIECELEEESEECAKKSSLLLQLVEDVEFFRDAQDATYATISINGRQETCLLESEYFRSWLSRIYWESYRQSISNYSKLEAISIMDGRARFEGECCPVFIRIGNLNNDTYVNLANDQASVVKISNNGWEILNLSPVKFIKNKNMKALPTPEAGGNLSLIWKYINIPEQYKVLVIAWLLECFRLDTEYPILLLHGSQGSAKSTTQGFLRDLIDPNVANLRGAPKNIDDIVVAAVNSHVLSFNNMSHLTSANQDELCSVSTGGGVGKRKLYTDQEEALSDIKRPIIMNGIHNPITAKDLLSRSIVIELPEISDQCRIANTELHKGFYKDYPYILGGLYDTYVAVMQILPEIKLTEMPRLADFSLLGTALERVLELELGAFMVAFNGNIESSMFNSLDSHPVLDSLIKFITVNLKFKGTYSELLDELSKPSYKNKSSMGWPSSAKSLAHLLKDAAYLLEKIGIKINFLSKRTNRGKLLEMSKL